MADALAPGAVSSVSVVTLLSPLLPPLLLLAFTSVFFQGIFSCMGDKSALFLSDAISYLAVASYPGGNVCICMAAKGGLERER